MNGYRENSFDPSAYEQPGRVLRPFNWVQWTGVALIVASLALDLLYFAGRLGWTRTPLGNPTMAVLPLVIGMSLINSRREPGTLITDDQRARNRKVLIITAAVCAVILGIAAVIDLQGA